ncbi:MAG: LemA family protein [Clostridiales bacterium]|nr:LemA family protein [Clostridiales bacterium]
MVTMSEEVDAKFSDIDTQLQRRSDLIPNLVNSVKGYMAHEQSIIDSVTTARTKLVNASSVAEKAEADSELTKALNNLLVVVENYPDIKASSNYTQLMDELSGTENRIATARRDYNGAVKDYNAFIKKFPQSIIAGIFNFDAKDYFEASESANEVPQVSFD